MIKMKDIFEFFYNGRDLLQESIEEDRSSQCLNNLWVYNGLTDESKSRLLKYLSLKPESMIFINHLFDKISISTADEPITFCTDKLGNIVVRPSPANPKAMNAAKKLKMNDIAAKSYSELISLRNSWAGFSCIYNMQINASSNVPLYVHLNPDRLRIEDELFFLDLGFMKFFECIEDDFLHLSPPSCMIDAYGTIK